MLDTREMRSQSRIVCCRPIRRACRFLSALLSGSFVVEYVTAWPGLGLRMYEALKAHDIYLVVGCAAMGAGLLAVGTLIGDLLLAAVDPRIRERASD